MFLLLDKRRVESFCPGQTGPKALLERSQAIHVPAHQWQFTYPRTNGAASPPGRPSSEVSSRPEAGCWSSQRRR